MLDLSQCDHLILSVNVTQGGRSQLELLLLSIADVFTRDPGKRWCWVPCVLGGTGDTHACPTLACLFPVPCGILSLAQPSIPSCPPSLPSLVAKSRAILLPMDLDAHMSALLSSGGSCAAAAQRSAANYKTATRTFPRVIPTANQWDYKNIIEKLQVGVAAWAPRLGLLWGGGGYCPCPSGGDLALPPRTSSQP